MKADLSVMVQRQRFVHAMMRVEQKTVTFFKKAFQ